MASMRVHELAKEFDMSSKELLDKLQQMGITEEDVQEATSWARK